MSWNIFEIFLGRNRGGDFGDLKPWPNKSPEPLTAVGAGSWRSQRCHNMDAPNITIAVRTVITVPPSFHFGATGAVHVASRRWFSFFR